MEKHNYVECDYCKWKIEDFPDFDWQKSPCIKCNNIRKVIDPKELLCNMCGETICPIGTINEQEPHGLYDASVIGGYSSYHLTDMNQYIFSFCEKCLRNMFIACKIKPTIFDLSFDQGETPQSWEWDQKSYEYKVWIDNGGHHQAYINKKCNAVKDCSNNAIYTELDYDDSFTENCCCENHKNNDIPFGYKLIKFVPNILKPFL